MSIGRRIVSLRKERGWTQARLANLAKLSASAIAMYETDRRTPDEASLEKLAGAFETAVHTLTGAAGATHETADLTQGTHTGVADKPQSAGPLHMENAIPTAAQMEAQAAGTAINSFATSHTNDFTDGTTQLSLTREEARIILFLRMNPQAMPFIQSYITANHQRRFQLEKTWRLINEFQQ